MRSAPPDRPVAVFSTCPPSSTAHLPSYRQQVIDVARWSEASGCTGILVYSDNSQLDPWLVSAAIVSHTTTLCPLVAVQPIYMHPYAVAKSVASIGAFWNRRIYLNMVAGGFKNDLIALQDTTPHDQRYERLTEYTQVITRLLEGELVTFAGAFYQVEKLKMAPALDADLFPGIFVSGSSDAGLAAARQLGATAIKYPQPAGEEPGADPGIDCGIRVGIIARPRAEEAWAVAYARFPEDRKGQITRNLATKVSDSQWHHQLAALDESAGRHAYWLVPFHNYKTMCPYLVGSYEEVAAEMAQYFAAGYRTVILDVPAGPEDLEHTFAAFQLALQPVP